MQIAPDSTDVTITFIARNTQTGLGKTGLVAANLTIGFVRVETDNDVTVTQLTAADLTALTDAHSDGGIKEVSTTLATGEYRLDLSDAVCASGARYVDIHVLDAGSNNFEVAPTRIELVSSSAPTAAAVADAVWDEATTSHTTSGTFGEQLKTDVDAIKVTTDKFVFTVANQVDANIQYVNDVLVTGAGTEADPWGP